MITEKQKITPKTIILMLFFIIIIPMLPLLISWHWGWWEAWVYYVICIVGFAISRVLAAKRNPGILAERARFLRHDNPESFDKILAPLVGLGGGLLPLVAGLDARFDWSASYSMPLKLVALLAILGGYSLGSWALIENAFFSGMVRIQSERNHHVISSGPYRWLRHPGYSGALLTYIATPIFLDAFWAFIPVILLGVTLIIRTNLEDKTLQAKLDGYSEYAKKVRYRLLPGIW